MHLSDRVGGEGGVARSELVGAVTEPALLDAQIASSIELGVPVVGVFWDLSAAVVRRLRNAGTVVVCQVGSVIEARAAEDAGAQVLIAQGVEAGGHVRGDRPLQDLVTEVAATAGVPVLAAGGIVDGAVLGTALMATQEAFAYDYHKRRRGERGDAFSGARTMIGEEEDRPIHLFSTDSPLRSMTGDFEAMALYAGSGVGRVHAISGAAQRVREIIAEAEALLGSGAVAPAGAMGDLHERAVNDDVLLSALNELLEAERAGARVALRTAKEVAESDLNLLVSAIHRDEARWCAVLTKAIHQLQGVPSKGTGAFYDKAMAITDIPARLAFLNRGQSWVVRKLQALLPGIRDARIHADLTAMLSSHIQNINLVAARLPTAAKPSVEGRI